MQQTIPRLPAVWSEAFPCSLHCGVFCLLLQCLRQFLQNEPHDEVRAEGHVLQRQPVSFYILPADGMGMLGGCPRNSRAHKLGNCHQGPLDTKGGPSPTDTCAPLTWAQGQVDPVYFRWHLLVTLSEIWIAQSDNYAVIKLAFPSLTHAALWNIGLSKEWESRNGKSYSRNKTFKIKQNFKSTGKSIRVFPGTVCQSSWSCEKHQQALARQHWAPCWPQVASPARWPFFRPISPVSDWEAFALCGSLCFSAVRWCEPEVNQSSKAQLVWSHSHRMIMAVIQTLGCFRPVINEQLRPPRWDMAPQPSRKLPEQNVKSRSFLG